jgi:hypothetical protein
MYQINIYAGVRFSTGKGICDAIEEHSVKVAMLLNLPEEWYLNLNLIPSVNYLQLHCWGASSLSL